MQFLVKNPAWENTPHPQPIGFFLISFLCLQNLRIYQFFEPYFKKLSVMTLSVFFIFGKVISCDLSVGRILNFLSVDILSVFEDFLDLSVYS